MTQPSRKPRIGQHVDEMCAQRALKVIYTAETAADVSTTLACGRVSKAWFRGYRPTRRDLAIVRAIGQA